MIGVGHEHLPGHLYVALGIADLDNSCLHVKLTIIILDQPVPGLEIEEHIADRNVGLLVGGFSVEMLVYQFLRFLVLLRIHQFLDLIVVVVRLGIVVVVRAAGPESGFIERNPLIFRPSEHIASHIAVADEQAVQPDFSGGFVVPQDHLPAGLGSGFGA